MSADHRSIHGGVSGRFEIRTVLHTIPGRGAGPVNYCNSLSTVCGSELACASMAVPDCTRIL
jgi:hypothetical protein